MYLSVRDKIAELLGLPTNEMYDELYDDYQYLLKKYSELVDGKPDKSKSPYIKVEENIFHYFNKYVVRTIHKKKRYSKSFDTLEDARKYLKEVKSIA